MYEPDAWRKPAFRAAAGPRLCCFRYFIVPVVAIDVKYSSVPSVLPSFTTIISESVRVCRTRLSTARLSSGSRLYVGTITEKVIFSPLEENSIKRAQELSFALRNKEWSATRRKDHPGLTLEPIELYPRNQAQNGWEQVY